MKTTDGERNFRAEFLKVISISLLISIKDSKNLHLLIISINVETQDFASFSQMALREIIKIHKQEY
jgi:hypothetical protein